MSIPVKLPHSIFHTKDRACWKVSAIFLSHQVASEPFNLNAFNLQGKKQEPRFLPRLIERITVLKEIMKLYQSLKLKVSFVPVVEKFSPALRKLYLVVVIQHPVDFIPANQFYNDIVKISRLALKPKQLKGSIKFSNCDDIILDFSSLNQETRDLLSFSLDIFDSATVLRQVAVALRENQKYPLVSSWEQIQGQSCILLGKCSFGTELYIPVPKSIAIFGDCHKILCYLLRTNIISENLLVITCDAREYESFASENTEISSQRNLRILSPDKIGYNLLSIFIEDENVALLLLKFWNCILQSNFTTLSFIKFLMFLKTRVNEPNPGETAFRSLSELFEMQVLPEGGRGVIQVIETFSQGLNEPIFRKSMEDPLQAPGVVILALDRYSKTQRLLISAFFLVLKQFNYLDHQIAFSGLESIPSRNYSNIYSALSELLYFKDTIFMDEEYFDFNHCPGIELLLWKSKITTASTSIPKHKHFPAIVNTGVFIQSVWHEDSVLDLEADISPQVKFDLHEKSPSRIGEVKKKSSDTREIVETYEQKEIVDLDEIKELFILLHFERGHIMNETSLFQLVLPHISRIELLRSILEKLVTAGKLLRYSRDSYTITSSLHLTLKDRKQALLSPSEVYSKFIEEKKPSNAEILSSFETRLLSATTTNSVSLILTDLHYFLELRKSATSIQNLVIAFIFFLTELATQPLTEQIKEEVDFILLDIADGLNFEIQDAIDQSQQAIDEQELGNQELVELLDG